MDHRSRIRLRRALLGLCAAPLLAGALAVAAVAQEQRPPAEEPMIPASRIPFYHDWAASPHARADAPAFTHWNDEGAIPEACAACHSTPGFLDYIGADGSAPGVVDRKAPTGTLVHCGACHNEAARQLTSVTFPSGLRVEDLGSDARCMTCHQGRTSGATVSEAVAGHDEDTVVPGLEFVNIHYRAAGATLMGALARGGYEYPGRDYAARRRHPAPFDGCISCHELHTVAPKTQPCAACHDGVTDRRSLAAIRKSGADFDGDGDTGEGIAAEVAALHARLLGAIQTYARDVAGTPIGYDGHTHPYFFTDSDGDGTIAASESKGPNKYAAWTPRLLKAAYNYQFVAKDPGAYAHNAPYVLQLMHDSLADLSGAAAEGIVRP